MSRSLLSGLAVLLVLAGCGPKSGDGGTDPNAAPAEVIPKVPRVMGFEVGKAVDAMGMIAGGVNTTFSPGDTINVSVMTENVGLGAKLEVALRQDSTHLATSDAVTPTPDSTGKAVVGMKVSPEKPLKPGHYQLQVLLEGKMQMAKDIEVVKM